jgi:hypothetical protein
LRTDQDAQKSRFARTVRSDDGYDLTAVDREINVAQDPVTAVLNANFVGAY